MAIERAQESEVNYLDKSQLKLGKNNETGGEILDGKGVLTRFPELEGRTFLCEPNLITPNPNQPRKYFDPKKMEELKSSIKMIGQKVPISVVPYFDGDNVRLFIIDGERRHRVVNQLGIKHALVLVEWVKTEQELLEHALILNESKADHNPIERASAYKKILEYEETKGTKTAVLVIAERLGISDQTIYNHLRLLKLPQEIQEMIAKGTLPTNQALQLRHAQKRFGEQLDMARLARLLLDNIERPEKDQPAGIKKLTRDAVQAALRGALLRGEDIEGLEVPATLHSFIATVRNVKRRADKMLAVSPGAMIDVLRRRGREGKPPEVVRDLINETIEALQATLLLIERAIKPDIQDKIEGKPDFISFLGMKGEKEFSGSKLRFRIARAVAEATDRGEVIDINGLSKVIKVQGTVINANIQSLRKELGQLGITLEDHTIRRKNRKGKYQKQSAYSLRWSKSERPVTALVEGTVEEEKPSRQKPLKVPEKPRVAVPDSVRPTLSVKPRPATDRAVSEPEPAVSELDGKVAAIRKAVSVYKAARKAGKSASVSSRAQQPPAQKETKARVSELKFAIEADKKLESVAQTIADYINSVTAVDKVYPDGQYTGEALILRIRQEQDGRYTVASSMRRFSELFGPYHLVFASKIAEAFGREAYSIQVAIRDIK